MQGYDERDQSMRRSSSFARRGRGVGAGGRSGGFLHAQRLVKRLVPHHSCLASAFALAALRFASASALAASRLAAAHFSIAAL